MNTYSPPAVVVKVPVLLVSGDRTTVESTRAQLPWVHGVTVKESIGTFSADSISPSAACAALAKGAAEAIRARAIAKPFTFEAPLTMDVQLNRTEQADYVAQIPGFERTGSRSVRFVDADMPTVFKAFIATFRLGSLA